MLPLSFVEMTAEIIEKPSTDTSQSPLGRIKKYLVHRRLH